LRNFKFEVLEECSVSQLDEKEGKTNGTQISKACNGKSQMAYGYLWRFALPQNHST
jgi:hypothetical protein